jgi:predicted  nucleic acid-binding Zn-ribbon protein
VQSLKEQKKELKKLLPKGIDPTIDALKKVVVEESPRYNDLLEYEATYREAKSAGLKNLQSQGDVNQAMAAVRRGLLELIDQLTPADIGLEPIKDEQQTLPPAIQRQVDRIDAKLARIQDRLIRIKGTDVSMEMRLEDEMEELEAMKEKLLAGS